MRILKKYVSTLVILVSGIVLAQYSIIPTNYSSAYDNQIDNNSTSVSAKLSAKEEIDLSISKMMTDPVLKNANWGFVVYDPKREEIITSYNENLAFIPASTTKLLTTDTALTLLGSNYKWLTQLEYSGEIDENGVLSGNLYIIGSGDPSIGTRKAGASSYASIASDFVYAVVNKGIKKVLGDIIIQTAVFKENKISSLPENIVWLEHNNYYLPVGSTQNINPQNAKLIVKNNKLSGGNRYFYVSPYLKKMVYAEKFDGQPLSTRLPNAPNYLATLFRNTLIKSGVSVLGKVNKKMVELQPESRRIITTYHSPEIKNIVFTTNQVSDNGLAESLLRMVGFQKNGDQTLESGKSVVLETLSKKGFDTSSLVYMDGSGLSRRHRVTPISQVKFLAKAMKEPYYTDFFASLPIAGQTGTLKRMFLGESYGQIYAKTGTLNKVKTLAGYIKTRTGRILTFSLLINNYAGSVSQVKNRMEQLLDPAVNL